MCFLTIWEKRAIIPNAYYKTGSLTISAGDTSGTFNVPILADFNYENNETATITDDDEASSTLAIDSSSIEAIKTDLYLPLYLVQSVATFMKANVLVAIDIKTKNEFPLAPSKKRLED